MARFVAWALLLGLCFGSGYVAGAGDLRTAWAALQLSVRGEPADNWCTRSRADRPGV